MSASELRQGWVLPKAPPSGVVPILGIRALRYQAEGRPGALPPIIGLRAQAVGVPGAEPRFDPVTGQLGFEDLPPGPRRILLTDPERRFFPAAMQVDIPGRFPQRPTLIAGDAARRATPLHLTILLRPHPSRAIPAGMTAVIGRLRDAQGRGIACGRLACVTVQGEDPALVVTWTDADGSFALLLPGEAPRLDRPAPLPVTRPLHVHLPSPGLAAALAADFTAALPADLDQLDPDGPRGLFLSSAARPLAADGQPGDAPPGYLTIRPGRTIRWDLVAG